MSRVASNIEAMQPQVSPRGSASVAVSKWLNMSQRLLTSSFDLISKIFLSQFRLWHEILPPTHGLGFELGPMV